MSQVIPFICQGKGLPEYFDEQLVTTIIGLHDMCKTVDWVAHEAKSLLNEEGQKQVEKLRQNVYSKVRSFRQLEMIAYNCMRQNREMNEQEMQFCRDFIELNESSVKEYLATVNTDSYVKN